MCMKFNFISICTYLCGVCPMYCSCSNYFGPNEFGYHFVLEFVLGTLEMHWKLVSYTRKVVSPCAYWSQAWMIMSSYLLHHQCYLGNKYLPHAYFSSFQPCVGCFLAWISFVAIHLVLAKQLCCKCGQAGMITYQGEYTYNHFHDSSIPYMLI
jgi:hypothetical protein